MAAGDAKKQDRQAQLGIDAGSNLFGGVLGLFGGAQVGGMIKSAVQDAAYLGYDLGTGGDIGPVSQSSTKDVGHPLDFHPTVSAATVKPSDRAVLGYIGKVSGKWRTKVVSSAAVSDVVATLKEDNAANGEVFLAITPANGKPIWNNASGDPPKFDYTLTAEKDAPPPPSKE